MIVAAFVRDAESDWHKVEEGGLGQGDSPRAEIVGNLEVETIGAWLQMFGHLRAASIGICLTLKDQSAVTIRKR